MKKMVSLLLSAVLLCALALPAYATTAPDTSVVGEWALTGAFTADGEALDEDLVNALFTNSDFIAEFREDGTEVNAYGGEKHEETVNNYTFDGKQVVIEGDEAYPLTLSEDGNLLEFDIDGELTIVLSRILPVHGVWTIETADGANDTFLVFNYNGTVDAYSEGKLQSEGIHFASDGDTIQMMAAGDTEPVELTIVNGKLQVKQENKLVQMARTTVDKLEAALTAEGKAIENVAGDVKDEAEKLAGEARDEAAKLGEAAGDEAAKIGEEAQDALGKAGDALGGAAEEVKEGAEDALNKAGDALGEAKDKVEGAVGDAVDKAGDAAGAAGDALKAAGEKVEDMASGVKDAVGDALAGAEEEVKDIAANVGGALEGAGEAIQAEYALIAEKLGGLVDAAKINIQSAAEQVKEFAAKVETGTWDTAEKVKDSIIAAYDKATNQG